MKVQACLMAFFISLPALAVQAPHVPARLELEAPKNIAGAKQGTVDIKLVDSKGQPFTATRDLKFNVKASAGQVDQQTVVIHKGASSAEVMVSKAAPGLSNVQVESADVATAGLSGGTQIGFTADAGYKPVLPLSLLVSVQPGTKLKANLDSAKVIVRYIDASKVPVPTKNAIKVAFPGLGNLLTPPAVNLAAGDLYGEATLSSTQPQVVPLTPVASPPTTVTSEAQSVEFISPIVATRVIPDHAYIKSVRHPKVELAVGFVDDQGNWINSDQDRTLLLQVDPQSAGILSASSVNILRGQSTTTVFFTPTQEGTSKIRAVAGDIPSPDAGFMFYYAAAYFWLIAGIGGLIGGVIRNALGSKHSLKAIAMHVLGGGAIGVVTYLVAPLLIGISLKPAGLENSSKIFEAFAWGFFGGGSGITLLGRIFGGKQEEAQAAAPAHAAQAPH